jgi:hypothetical protein
MYGWIERRTTALSDQGANKEATSSSQGGFAVPFNVPQTSQGSGLFGGKETHVQVTAT